MRKIIKTNAKIETYQALDSVVKYLSNCYNKWDIVIMKFSTKYNLIFKNNEICFDLDKIYNTLFTNSNKEYKDMLYFDKITFRTTTKYQEEGAEESELTIDKINKKDNKVQGNKDRKRNKEYLCFRGESKLMYIQQ